MKKILFSLLIFQLFNNISSGSDLIKNYDKSVNHSEDIIYFESLTEGKIFFNLAIPGSEKAHIINIYNINKSAEEIVFSIPLIAGEILYPYKISSDDIHRMVIEFDFNYNFCKVYIDGVWLTSLLAKKQYNHINGIKIEFAPGSNTDGRLTNFHTEGTLSEPKIPVKIVTFGNSTTANRRTITGVYSQRMPEYFKKQNIPVLIFNEGIGGSHTGHITDNARHKIRHALDRFDESVLAKNPDYVILNFGINDSWIDNNDPRGESRIPLSKFQENLIYMIRILKEKNITIILMTPSAFGENVEFWRKERTEKYVKIIRDLAKKEKLLLVDQWKIMNKISKKEGRQVDFYLLDGVHPNDNWHKIEAEIIVELIAKENE